jgi:hypothetical protein
MKYNILLSLTLASTISFGQNCNYEKNEVDKFTKKKVVETKREKLFGTLNSSGFYTVKQEGDNFYIEFDYLVQSSFSGASRVATNIAVKEKDQLMFLLENDEVVTLESSSTVQSQMKPNLSSGLVNWELNDVKYPVTLEQLKTLQSAKTTTLRIYRTIGFDAQNIGQQESMDVDIKKASQDDMQNMIHCVINQ